MRVCVCVCGPFFKVSLSQGFYCTSEPRSRALKCFHGDEIVGRGYGPRLSVLTVCTPAAMMMFLHVGFRLLTAIRTRKIGIPQGQRLSPVQFIIETNYWSVNGAMRHCIMQMIQLYILYKNLYNKLQLNLRVAQLLFRETHVCNKTLWQWDWNNVLIRVMNNGLNLYSAFLGAQSTLHRSHYSFSPHSHV